MTCVAQLLANGGQESLRGLVTWAEAAAPERVQEKQGGWLPFFPARVCGAWRGYRNRVCADGH